MLYRNATEALMNMPRAIADRSIEEDSRNGPVLSCPEPITLTITHPWERVALVTNRRANPFLFLLDGLSILSNVNLAKPFTDIVPRFRYYTDDGVTLRAHYGRRLYWQIPTAVAMLREQSASRRVVMQIWNSDEDLGAESKDIPCNTHVALRIVDGRLDLTVFNRSNDLFWGMLGANIVQFSFLQEYIALKLGVQMGRMHMVSNNVHIYRNSGPQPPYEFTPLPVAATHIPLSALGLRNDLNMLFLRLAEGELWDQSDNPFMISIVYPMLRAWRDKDPDHIHGNCDWFVAGQQWFKENGR